MCRPFAPLRACPERSEWGKLSRSALLRPDYRVTFAFFCQKTRSIVVHYREICELSAKKPDQLSVIVSLTPLFSYTTPEVPSFLTSL
jgi:hypothetical protein